MTTNRRFSNIQSRHDVNEKSTELIFDVSMQPRDENDVTENCKIEPAKQLCVRVKYRGN